VSKFQVFNEFLLIDANEINPNAQQLKKKRKNSTKFEKFINTGYLTQTTSILMSIQTSLAKGIYMANLRFFLDLLVTKVSKFMVKNSESNPQNPIGEDMNDYLINLMENNQKLPIFVYFARLLESKFSQTIDKNSNQKLNKSIEEIAVESGIKCVETFC
jgi:uncharacterized membrane protein YwzB